VTRLLVLEGSPPERRRQGEALGVRSNSGMYVEALRLLDDELHIDVVEGVDGLDGLPGGCSLEDYDGFVLGGSGLRCADDTPEVRNQIELLRAFATLERPILGSCWGLQIAALAAGGAVRPCPPGRELPFAKRVSLTEAGSAHPLFDGKQASFDTPCIHFDEVLRLPADSVHLASNAHSAVQAADIPIGNSRVWAVQYHPEFDVRHMADLLRWLGDDTVNEARYADCDERDEAILQLDRAASGDDAAFVRLGVRASDLAERERTREIGNWLEHAVLRLR